MKWQEWRSVADDAAIWAGRQEKGLLKAEYIDNYRLRLWFEEELDVSIYELDFHPLLVEENLGGVFSVLKKKDRFQYVRGDYALVWPDPEMNESKTVDLAPECVRFFCERYGKTIKKVRKK
ncbi:hypothetical protein [Candidatus Electronema sp. JC]|uniref:hypothetical protein n=1 Tax=Candidatus Electronema sp. JC TaxID=3401570 RepID=UPI003AA9604C